MAYVKNDNDIPMWQRKRRDKVSFATKMRDTKVIAIQNKMKDDLPIRKKEIEYIKNKYFLTDSQIKSISTYYFKEINVPNNTIVSIANLIENILEYMFGYTEEDIIKFFQGNILIFKSNYTDLKNKLTVFNHFNLLEEVIVKGIAYLNSFSKYDIKVLYALFCEYNINSMEELNEIIEKLQEKKLLELRKKHIITTTILEEFNEELKRKINKSAFIKKLQNRKNAESLE